MTNHPEDLVILMINHPYDQVILMTKIGCLKSPMTFLFLDLLPLFLMTCLFIDLLPLISNDLSLHRPVTLHAKREFSCLWHQDLINYNTCHLIKSKS